MALVLHARHPTADRRWSRAACTVQDLAWLQFVAVVDKLLPSVDSLLAWCGLDVFRRADEGIRLAVRR